MKKYTQVFIFCRTGKNYSTIYNYDKGSGTICIVLTHCFKASSIGICQTVLRSQ